MERFAFGQSVTRREDPRLLTGAGRYSDDIDLPEQAHAVLVRSPHAHARVRSIDADDARAMEGVLAVYTGRDLDAAGLGTLPCLLQVPTADGSEMVMPPRPLLAGDVVRHVGEPVAMVVAADRDTARSAAEEVLVDYEMLDAVCDTASAADEDKPRVHEQAPRNTSFVWEHGDGDAAERALAGSARVVRLTLVNNRIIANPLEPRVALGYWEDDRFTLYTPTQGPHKIKQMLAEHIFGMAPESFRVVTTDVGGGFGMKIFLYAEQALVLFAARALNRPVKWVAERSADGFVSDAQGRDQVNEVELGVDEEARFTALRVHTHGNLGAYLSNFGPGHSTLFGIGVMPGAYRIPVVHARTRGVFTNTVPTDAYRGAGRPEAAYLLERTVDAAARELGMDPAELRRRNFIATGEMPYRTAVGRVYDSGDFARIMDAALCAADRGGFEQRRRQSRQQGRWRGLGIAYYIEACGGAPRENAELQADGEGRVWLLIGTQNNGQGHETAYTQVLAEKLGIDAERIGVLQGDTDIVATGNGTGGSRSIPVGAVVSEQAADDLIEKGRRLAAEHLEAAEADIEYANGSFRVAGTDRGMELGAIAARVAESQRLAGGRVTGLTGSGEFSPEAMTFPNGCHVCELEVDPETGGVEILRYTVVDDFGRVLNPDMLAGQVHGGIAQGIGQAMLEHCVYEEGSGQLLSGSLNDYCLPRADDVPRYDFRYDDSIPCATNPMGVKGAGEAGAIGAPPAVINAIVDALAGVGVSHVDMPATPLRVWQAINQARTG